MGLELYGIGPNFNETTQIATDAYKFAYYTGQYLPITNTFESGDVLIYRRRKTQFHAPTLNQIKEYRLILPQANTKPEDARLDYESGVTAKYRIDGLDAPGVETYVGNIGNIGTINLPSKYLTRNKNVYYTETNESLYRR
jgi:hypothetical protein